MTLQLGILASGAGSNALSIIKASKEGRLDADVRIVIANRPGAQVLEKARGQGIAALCLDHGEHDSRESHDEHIVKALIASGVDTVALAGYMRLVTNVFLDAFPGRVLNLHPTLLPAFAGVHGYRECWNYGAKIGGCTVHFVDPVMDGGPIVIQAALPVLQEEDDKQLLESIHALEHRIYPQALAWLAAGRLCLQGRRVILAPGGKSLAQQPENALVWPPLENGF